VALCDVLNAIQSVTGNVENILIIDECHNSDDDNTAWDGKMLMRYSKLLLNLKDCAHLKLPAPSCLSADQFNFCLHYLYCSAAVDSSTTVLPYLLPSVRPGADLGVQAVRLQVTETHRCEQLAQGCYAALSRWELRAILVTIIKTKTRIINIHFGIRKRESLAAGKK